MACGYDFEKVIPTDWWTRIKQKSFFDNAVWDLRFLKYFFSREHELMTYKDLLDGIPPETVYHIIVMVASTTKTRDMIP